MRISRVHPGFPVGVAKDAIGREFTYTDLVGFEKDSCEIIRRVGAGVRGSRWLVRCSLCDAESTQESTEILRRNAKLTRFCCRSRSYADKLLDKTFDNLKVLDLVPGLNGATIARLRCTKCGARFRSHARYVGTQSSPKCPVCSGGRSRA